MKNYKKIFLSKFLFYEALKIVNKAYLLNYPSLNI